jgi:hypothetical protein
VAEKQRALALFLSRDSVYMPGGFPRAEVSFQAGRNHNRIKATRHISVCRLTDNAPIEEYLTHSSPALILNTKTRAVRHARACSSAIGVTSSKELTNAPARHRA